MSGRVGRPVRKKLNFRHLSDSSEVVPAYGCSDDVETHAGGSYGDCGGNAHLNDGYPESPPLVASISGRSNSSGLYSVSVCGSSDDENGERILPLSVPIHVRRSVELVKLPHLAISQVC